MSPTALQKPEFVGPDWWDAVMRVASTAMTRDELDRKVRKLTHEVYQAYQTIEGNALSRERKDQIHSLKRASREAWRHLHGGLPPKPTHFVFVGYIRTSERPPLHEFEAAGGRVRPAGPAWKLETEDPALAERWGCVHTEARG
jgi:hypothetical protein